MADINALLRQLLDHGIPDEALIKIARIVLNWGAADNHIGYSLSFLYRITDEHHQLELVHAIDMRKKVDLLRKRVATLGRDDDLATWVQELSSVVAQWANDRNLVAHGSGITLPEGVALHSAKKQISVPLQDLDKFLTRSSYVVHLTVRINSRLAGIQWDPYGPLPERPA